MKLATKYQIEILQGWLEADDCKINDCDFFAGCKMRYIQSNPGESRGDLETGEMSIKDLYGRYNIDSF